MKRNTLVLGVLATSMCALTAGASGAPIRWLGWTNARVVRVGEQRAPNELFRVVSGRGTWITGISLRVQSDDLKTLNVETAYQKSDGRITREWIGNPWAPQEVSYSVPSGYAVVGISVRCNSDDARHMVVYYRRFDERGLTGSVRYAVVQHDRSTGSWQVVQTGYDRPTGFPIEQTAYDPDRLLIGLGMRVNSDDFKHIEATFATPTVR